MNRADRRAALKAMKRRGAGWTRAFRKGRTQRRPKGDASQ